MKVYLYAFEQKLLFYNYLCLLSPQCQVYSVRTNWDILKIILSFHLSKNAANLFFWCVNFSAWQPRELNCYPATICLWLRYCADQYYCGSYRAVRTTWRPTRLAMWCSNEGYVVNWGHEHLNYYFHMQEEKGGGSEGGNELQIWTLLQFLVIFISKLTSLVFACTVIIVNHSRRGNDFAISKGHWGE